MAAPRLIACTIVFLVLAGCASSPPAVPKAAKVAPDDWPGLPAASHSGTIFFGAQPTLEGLEYAAGNGVALVINLRTPDEMRRLDFDEAAFLRDRGIRYVQIPVTSDSLSDEDVTEFGRALRGSSGELVLVHCGSSNRVGAMWAAYLMQDRGYSASEALEHGKAAGLTAPRLIQQVNTLADDS